MKKIFSSCGEFMIFLGAVAGAIPEIFRRRTRRWREFFYYAELCGFQSLPIVIMLCFLMGVVLGIQGAIQMRKVGTEIFMVDLIGFSVLKELGPLMVAIIATGRAGSSFAAEIGSMKAEEEISALTTMGISPVRFLVVPKLLAMIISLPFLIIFADIAGILGGLAVSMGFLGLPAETYMNRIAEALSPMVFVLGVFKGVFFGAMIALVGCREGFRSSADSQGVGRAATSAVVRCILFLIIIDTLITVIYSFWGY